MGLAEIDHLPLLNAEHSDNFAVKRTGTLWTAVAHVITGLIGSGVLSLAWAVAQLGWIAGPVSLLFFATFTLFATFPLCDSYKYPDPETGPIRNRSYIDAVRVLLGERSAQICGVSMHLNYYGTGIAYVITTGICLRAILKSNCYHKYGHDAPCEFGDTYYMLIFGVVQIFLSQIPDFHSMDWLSVVAAVMSFGYASIGVGLGAAKVIGKGVVEGSVSGVSTSTSTEKVWIVSQALGNVAFSFPFSTIILNIQDTLRSPPPENETMKRASVISVCITTFFYLTCGGLGYAAFGDQTPGNILTGFGYYEPYWLVDLANACIVLHLLGGYQVYSQPVFALMDQWFADQLPDYTVVSSNYELKLPLAPRLNLNLQRLFSRTAYVASTTAIAMIFPFFNQVLGVLGAINFWPIAIYFPVEMYLRQRNIEPWTIKWILLRSISTLFLFINIFALVGSIEGIIVAKSSQTV